MNQRELNSDLSKEIDALSQEVSTKTEKLKDMELELNQILQVCIKLKSFRLLISKCGISNSEVAVANILS